MNTKEIRQKFIDYFQQMQTQLTDPQSREMANTLLQKLNTPEGFATLITVGLAVSFFFFLALGAAGGAIGAAVIQRNQRR